MAFPADAKKVRKSTGFTELAEHVLKQRAVAKLVAGAIGEGDVARGEVLKIFVHELPTIVDYVPGTGISLTGDGSAYVNVNNQKDKAINEVLDGLTAEMAYDKPGYIGERLEAASEAIAQEMDKDLFNILSTDGTAATAVAFTSAVAFAEILKIKLALDKAGAPNEDRFLIVTPEVENAILSAPNLVLSTPTGDSILYAGYIGNIFGFKVLRTNLLPNKVQLIGVQSRGIAFADGWKVEPTLFDLNDTAHVGDSKIGGRIVYNPGVVRPTLVQYSKTA